MKSGLFGYNKNQIRVYFTTNQSTQQQELDQLEGQRIALQASIDETTRNIEQMENEFRVCSERITQMEEIWGRVELINNRVITQAQANALSIMDGATENAARLLKEKLTVNRAIKECYQAFTSLISNSEREWHDMISQGE